MFHKPLPELSSAPVPSVKGVSVDALDNLKVPLVKIRGLAGACNVMTELISRIRSAAPFETFR